MFELQKKVVQILINDHSIDVNQAWSAVLEYEDREVFNYMKLAGITDNLLPNIVKWCLERLDDIT